MHIDDPQRKPKLREPPRMLASWSCQLSPRRRHALRTSINLPGQIKGLRRGPVGFSATQPLEKKREVGSIDIFSTRGIRAMSNLAARTQRSAIIRAAAFLAVILIPSLSSAAIYKCTAQDGGITYTDVPCPADTMAQYIDPAMPSWLTESSQNINSAAALPDAKSQSQPEILAILCANDEFEFWLKAQRHSLPERDVRTAKFIHISYLCRKALHLPDVATPLPPMPLKRVLGQETPWQPILSRN
jgi:hypothetical protein